MAGCPADKMETFDGVMPYKTLGRVAFFPLTSQKFGKNQIRFKVKPFFKVRVVEWL